MADCPFHTPRRRTSRGEEACPHCGPERALKSHARDADARPMPGRGPAPRRRSTFERFGPRQASGRRESLVVAILSVAVGLSYLVLAFQVVFSMSIGPIAVSIDEGLGRGVHTGDLLALPIAALGVACLAFGLSSLDRRRRVTAVLPRSVDGRSA